MRVVKNVDNNRQTVSFGGTNFRIFKGLKRTGTRLI